MSDFSSILRSILRDPATKAGSVTAAVAVLLIALFVLGDHTDKKQEDREATSRLESIAQSTAAAEADLRQLRNRQAAEAARAAQREAARGALSILSVPEGATVSLNGIEVGTTPLTLSDLRLGPYALQINMDGFVKQNQSLDVPEGTTTVPTIQLARATGTLKVATLPPGLSLRIERSSSPIADEPFETIRTVAPLETTLPTGYYVVYTAREGYSEIERPAHIEADRSEELEILMTPARIEITSIPSGAEVHRYGEKVGITPYSCEVPGPIFGTYEIRMDGYVPEEVYSSVSLGEVVRREVHLRQAEAAEPSP